MTTQSNVADAMAHVIECGLTIALIRPSSQNGESVNNGALCGTSPWRRADLVSMALLLTLMAAQVAAVTRSRIPR